MSAVDHPGMGTGADANERQPILDPVDRISEILFGLLMALSFTGAVSVATSGREDVRTMMFAALGCNLAWGLVDGVMYLVRTYVARAYGAATVRAVQAAPDTARARSLIARAMPDALSAAMTDADLDRMRARIRELPEPPSRPPLVGRDFAAAAAIFALVVAATFPVVVPFILVPDAMRAIRWSNAIAVAMLFAAGVALGRYAGLGTFRTGGMMVALGLVMVGGIVFFGG
jgi:hypothetical protein